VFSGLESPFHWLVLAVVLLLVFGPKRLPELGRSLGSGLRGFRDSLSGLDDGGDDAADAPQPREPE
jgi:sec-independent protein translocase protein TatA